LNIMIIYKYIMIRPNFQEEKKLWERGVKRVVGIDEAGRGPLAGPVTAAAVIFRRSDLLVSIFGRSGLHEVNDSKKLSPKMREKLFGLITKNKNIDWGIGVVSEKVIDKINIKNAAELAMEKATRELKKKPDFLIIDGNSLKNSKLRSYDLKLIIKADAKVFSVAAASILAKVTRDRIMQKYHKKYPQYHFDLHKGYGTKLHLAMLKKHGPCQIHRQSFGPVAAASNY
jgi:ribonuclease HII